VTPEQVLDVIAERLDEWPVDRQDGALFIENLNLRVTCGTRESCGDGCALVSASHPSLPRPHEQHCAGWGDDERSQLFVGQLNDDAPRVDCWFDNLEWPAGAEVLAKLRADWGPVPGYEGLRQSVLFKPVPIEQIPASTIAALPK
jgi:hypothetical protein